MRRQLTTKSISETTEIQSAHIDQDTWGNNKENITDYWINGTRGQYSSTT